MLSKPKKPGVPYFTPDKRQCLILGNFDYSPIRYMGVDNNGNPKELGIKDLLHVKTDIKLFKEKIEGYGFADDGQDILEMTNLGVDKVKKVFLGYQRKINDNAD